MPLTGTTDWKVFALYFDNGEVRYSIEPDIQSAAYAGMMLSSTEVHSPLRDVIETNE